MIKRRVPIHFGGMSDPFQAAEAKWRVSLTMLRSLSVHKYPTVISTKGTILLQPEYLETLKGLENVVVQFSMSTIRDARAGIVEPLATKPSRLLAAMEALSRAGIPVTCRWQPFIPGFSDASKDFVIAVASTGARHLALEHLKIPVEGDFGRDSSSLTIRRIKATYRRADAMRDGREYVLPPTAKLDKILEVRAECRSSGMTFGAADNEFQYLSDGSACCSGVDLLGEAFKRVFGFTITVPPSNRCRLREAEG